MSSCPAPRPGVHRGLLVPAVVGAVWRVGMLLVDKWNQPLLLNDSLYYSAQARQLVDGVWFREIFVDQPGAEHGPLTSILMAPVSWMADPVPWQRSVTVVCGVITVVLIGVLATRLAGRRAGTVAAWIAAASPNLWMNDGLVMSESVSMLAVVTTMLLVERAMVRRDAWSFAAVGVAAGLAAHARSELAILTPGVAILLWWTSAGESCGADDWRAHRSGLPRLPRLPRLVAPALVIGLAVATVSPWVVFNLVRFERPVTLTTNDGTTLLGAYCDATFSGADRGGWSLVCVLGDPDYRQDEEPSMRSARQRDLAFTYARHHLGELPGVVAARVGRTFDLYRLDSLVAQDVGEERYRWASWAGIGSWWLLCGVVLAGVRPLRRELAPQHRWLLALPAVAVLLTTTMFYGGHRIRSSLEPSLVIAAAVVLAARWSARRSGRGRPPGRTVSAAPTLGDEPT